jgi:hypothetical protein
MRRFRGTRGTVGKQSGLVGEKVFLLANFLIMAAELAPERVLCFNMLLDESRKNVGLFRHPLFAYSEEMRWPPANWAKICCWHCCHTCP